jgi:hypothetical protein
MPAAASAALSAWTATIARREWKGSADLIDGGDETAAGQCAS